MHETHSTLVTNTKLVMYLYNLKALEKLKSLPVPHTHWPQTGIKHFMCVVQKQRDKQTNAG